MLTHRTNEPFVWDGEHPVRLTVDYAANFSASAQDTTIRLEIFTYENRLVYAVDYKGKGISPVIDHATLPTDGWSGESSIDSVSPSGKPLSRGLYLYRFVVKAHSIGGQPVPDTGEVVKAGDAVGEEKSTSLHIARGGGGTDKAVQLVSANPANFTFEINVHLTRAAQSVKITVWNPDAVYLGPNISPHYVVGEQSFDAPDDQTLGNHKYTVSLPKSAFSSFGSRYYFVVSAKEAVKPDGTSIDGDNGGVSQWALQYAPVKFISAATLAPLTPDGSPPVFRGGPEPCPIVIKGQLTSTLEPTILGVEFTKVRDVGNGVYEAAPGFSVRSDPKKPVWRSLSLEKVRDKITVSKNDPAPGWNFRLVWSQDLDRTLTTKDDAGNSVKNEYWQVRVRAMSDEDKEIGEDEEESPSALKRFRIFMMAHPTEGDTFRGFTTVGGSQTVFTTFKTQSDVALRVWTTSAGKHNGADIGLVFPGLPTEQQQAFRAGKPLYAAEDGTLFEGRWIKWSDNEDLLQREGDDDFAKKLEKYSDTTRYRLEIVERSGVANNYFILGPRRIMHHEMVTLRQVSKNSDSYLQKYIQTVYAHREPEDDADISTTTAIGPRAISDEIGAIGRYLQNEPGQSGLLLKRGYFVLRSAILQVKDGSGGVVETFDKVQVVFSSTSDPHLHFEVRLFDTKDAPDPDDQYSGFDVDDPKYYLDIPLQKRKRAEPTQP